MKNHHVQVLRPCCKQLVQLWYANVTCAQASCRRMADIKTPRKLCFSIYGEGSSMRRKGRASRVENMGGEHSSRLVAQQQRRWPRGSLPSTSGWVR